MGVKIHIKCVFYSEVSIVQTYCDFSACMYNDDGCCDREKIFLDSNGVCESCVFSPDEVKEE